MTKRQTSTKTASTAVRMNGRPVLPSQNATRGLSFKVPKGNKSSDIHKRLKKKSPWYSSILDPLHGADAKVPDETGVDTGTMQLVMKNTFTTSASGFGGIRMFTPYINSWELGEGPDAEQGINWQKASGTETTLAWGLDPETGSCGPFTGVEEFKAITNAHRIVSACLIVQPEASLDTNKGEYTLGLSEFSTRDSPYYEEWANSYKAIMVPVSQQGAGIIRWFPVARNDWNFKSFIRTNGEIPGSDDTGPDNVTVFPIWNLACVASGCAEGVVFRTTMVVNYEFIPIHNTLNIIDASPSPQDAMEVDLVENWVQEMNVASPIATRAVSSPSPVSVQHGENDEGSGFGMFFNVVKEILPMALALI